MKQNLLRLGKQFSLERLHCVEDTLGGWEEVWTPEGMIWGQVVEGPLPVSRKVKRRYWLLTRAQIDPAEGIRVRRAQELYKVIECDESRAQGFLLPLYAYILEKIHD